MRLLKFIKGDSIVEIQIKSYFKDWKTVDKETATRYILSLNFAYKTEEDFIEYIEEKKLRGIKVLELIPDFGKEKEKCKENEYRLRRWFYAYKKNRFFRENYTP